jgi:hypothetical protein
VYGFKVILYVNYIFMENRVYKWSKIIVALLFIGVMYLIAEGNRYQYIKLSDRDSYAVVDKWTRTYRVGVLDFQQYPYDWQRHEFMPQKNGKRQ